MRRILAIVALVCAPSFAQQTLRLDPDATHVLYTLGDVLHTVHGAFKLKSGEIRFDPATGKASGALIVDAASGNSGNTTRDRRMNSNILDTTKYPEITFTPDRVDGALNPEGDSEVRVHGIFRIHGADHELVLPVKAHISGVHFSGDIQFAVPYVEWGMKNPSTMFLRVNNTVQIQIYPVGTLAATAP